MQRTMTPTVSQATAQPRANARRAGPRLALAPLLALSPAWLIALGVFVGTTVWTVQISLTNSRMLPSDEFAGLDQYDRLFASGRWLVSLQNLAILGTAYVAGCLVLGFLLAVAIDRRVRFENALRTVFLYPYALSFIVTGLVWQWLMNPELGIQAAVRGWGLEGFTFDWTTDRGMAIYAVALAGLWQSSGLVMVLMLAGLRGIDADLWKAARVEGIPVWRTYVSIILPQLGPFVATATTLLVMNVVRTFDLVVALTNGGPGTATEVPAKFVMDNLFGRQDLGLATAGATVMLVTIAAVVAPFLYLRHLRARRRAG